MASSGQEPTVDHEASLEHFLAGTCCLRGQLCFERRTTPCVVEELKRAFPCSPEQTQARSARRAQALQAQTEDAQQLAELQATVDRAATAVAEATAAVRASKNAATLQAKDQAFHAKKAADAALRQHAADAKRRRADEAAAEADAQNEPAWLQKARGALGPKMAGHIAEADQEWDLYTLCEILRAHLRVFMPLLTRRWAQQQPQQDAGGGASATNDNDADAIDNANVEFEAMQLLRRLSEASFARTLRAHPELLQQPSEPEVLDALNTMRDVMALLGLEQDALDEMNGLLADVQDLLERAQQYQQQPPQQQQQQQQREPPAASVMRELDLATFREFVLYRGVCDWTRGLRRCLGEGGFVFENNTVAVPAAREWPEAWKRRVRLCADAFKRIACARRTFAHSLGLDGLDLAGALEDMGRVRAVLLPDSARESKRESERARCGFFQCTHSRLAKAPARPPAC
jgi:hypothetical protein